MLLSKFDAVNGAVFYAAGVFHYFITQQIRDMVVAKADTSGSIVTPSSIRGREFASIRWSHNLHLM